MSKEGITVEQEAALEGAIKLLKAEFESMIVLVRATDENGNSSYPAQWHGHTSDVRGLLAIAAARLDKHFTTTGEAGT